MWKMEMFTNIFVEKVLCGEKSAPSVDEVEVAEEVLVEEAEEVEFDQMTFDVLKDNSIILSNKSVEQAQNIELSAGTTEKIDTDEKSPKEDKKFDKKIDKCKKNVEFSKNLPSMKLERSRLKDFYNIIKLETDSFAIKGSFNKDLDGAILFFPSSQNLRPQVIGKVLTPSCLKPVHHQLPIEKVKIISNAKRKASRKSTTRYDVDLESLSSPTSLSSCWQKLISEEFSKRMSEFLAGSRFNSFKTLSKEKVVKPIKCQCCHFFQEKKIRKCLLEDSLNSKSVEDSDPNAPLFSCDVTMGHLKGDPMQLELRLSRLELQLISDNFNLNIPIQSIQEIQIDDFLQICFITFQRQNSLESDQVLRLENFSGRLNNFLIILEYLLRTKGRWENFISQFSWNFYLCLPSRSQLVIFVCPVNVSIKESLPADGMLSPKESSLMFNIFNPEGCDTKTQRWSFAHFSLKINTLYMFSKEEDELPEKFWLLNQNSFIHIGDEFENRPNTLRIIPEDGQILNLSFPSVQQMIAWQNDLEAAKHFKASDFVMKQVDGSTTNLSSFLALTDKCLFLFNCDEKVICSFREMQLTQLTEIKHRKEKIQMILRFGTNSETTKRWNISFQSSGNLLNFKQMIEKITKNWI